MNGLKRKMHTRQSDMWTLAKESPWVNDGKGHFLDVTVMNVILLYFPLEYVLNYSGSMLFLCVVVVAFFSLLFISNRTYLLFIERRVTEWKCIFDN